MCSRLLAGLLLVLAATTGRSEVVFQDDFSEANGTVINGKASDIGGTWWSGDAANQVNGGTFTQVAGESSVSFTRAPGTGEVITVTIVAASGSSFTFGGWTGLTLQPWGGSDSLSFGDSGTASDWRETGGGAGTGDSSAPNTVTVTYDYDTGGWTLETSALPGSVSGFATAGLAMQELRFWDDGSGGSVIQFDSITVEIGSSVPPEPPVAAVSYVDWAVYYNVTSGRYDDQDGDGLVNLAEYAVNGNPTAAGDTGIALGYSVERIGGSDWFYFVYPERAGVSKDVEYSLWVGDNLLSNNWVSTGIEAVATGTNAVATGFNSVTNRIPMDGEESRFVRLAIGSGQPDEWRGGDLSMVPRFEQLGGRYKINGQVIDPIHIMMNYGMNTFRVRLFVDPSNSSDTAVIQDLAYVTALGQRIKNAGAKFLLDIHYSDTWADPTKQTKPADWEGLSFSELEAQVETYSSNVIATLKSAGCLPDIVQVGNEVTGGFIWPEGKIYNEPLGGWSHFTTLLKAGIRGAKAPLEAGENMKIMIHIDNGGNQSGMHYFYNQLANYGVQYDMIGLSFYPWWHGTLTNLQNTLNDAAASFGKEIVVVETAFPWRSNYSSMQWAQTPAGQKEFIEDVLQAVRSLPGGLGKGVIWWYPEAVADVPFHVWEGGANALFDSSWNALPALEPF